MNTNFYRFLVLLVFLGSCSDGTKIQKPEKLISPQKMEKIIYDLSIMNGLRSATDKNELFEPIMNVAYIYKKHKVDSAQLADSEAYYSKHPLQYLRIHRNVENRLLATQDSLNNLGRKEN
ncbi:MAG: DUF4296 domain-containing protein [Flavobacteriaceae bacterium]